MPVDVLGAGSSLAAATAAWLLSFIVHSTVLLGGVWLLTRRRGLAVSWNETLWKAAMVGGIVSATWQSLGIGAPLGGTFFLTALEGARPAADPAVLSGLPAVGASPSWWSALPVAPILLGVWFAGTAVGLTRLVLSRRRLVRLLGPRREVREGPAAEALARLARTAGFRRPVRLTVSSRIGGPMALGGLEICIPERALVGLTPEQQESALAHELAHLARRDPGWNWFTAILGHVFFFQPLFRVARRRLRESAEYLSDDWAVRHTGRGIVLARCLVEVAGWRGARPAAAFGAAMADHPSSLSRRIERLVGGPRREPARVLRLAGALALLFSVTALAPGIAPARRSPLPEFDPSPWVLLSDAGVTAPSDTPEPPDTPWLAVPQDTPAPSPSEAAIPPAGKPGFRVVPTPPAVPAPPGSPEEGIGALVAPETAPPAGMPARVVVLIVPRATRLASSPTPRVLRDEEVAPVPGILDRQVVILRSQADLERAQAARLVIERDALLRGLDAEQARVAALGRALEATERRGNEGAEFELLLEAYRAELRARLDALRAAAISSRI